MNNGFGLKVFVSSKNRIRKILSTERSSASNDIVGIELQKGETNSLIYFITFLQLHFGFFRRSIKAAEQRPLAQSGGEHKIQGVQEIFGPLQRALSMWCTHHRR